MAIEDAQEGDKKDAFDLHLMVHYLPIRLRTPLWVHLKAHLRFTSSSI